MERIKNTILKISHKNIIALIFIFLIFYIGSVIFPSTLVRIGKLLEVESNTKRNIVTFIKDIDKDYYSMLDSKDNFIKGKGTYINLNGFMAKNMGQTEMNKRIKLNNGNLYAICDKKDIIPATKQITKLYKNQISRNKHFLFVLAPSKISTDKGNLPIRYKEIDFSNEIGDNLIESLISNNVPILDLREEMQKDGVSFKDAFFATDHHWKPETGFWAYTKIVEYMYRNDMIKEINKRYIDIDNYYIKNYEKQFLGSDGKRTGIYFAGTDDFPIITPNFETELSVNINSGKEFKEGSFEKVAYNHNRNIKDYFSAHNYQAYGNGDKKYISYRNELGLNNLKVLALGDSFANVPYSFLTLLFKSFDQLDMRYYDEDFKEYYEEYEPDLVILLISPNGVSKQNALYDYFGDDAN